MSEARSKARSEMTELHEQAAAHGSPAITPKGTRAVSDDNRANGHNGHRRAGHAERTGGHQVTPRQVASIHHSPPGRLAPVWRILRGLWRLVTINRKVMLGSAIIAFFIVVAIIGPLLVSQNPLTYTRNLMAPPSAAHWLGTNQGGQDVFSQLVVGTRDSVFWSFVTGLLVLVIAVSVGLVAGYFGGVIDDALSLITNVFLVIPAFPLAIIGVQFFSRTTLTIALIVALTNWPWGARVLRSQTLSLRAREFISAARANGESTRRIIFFDIFPNELSIVAASFITTTIQVLLAVAGLQFLGFGDSQTVSWGTMLYDAYNGSALFQGAWWWFAPPGMCIALLGSGLALLNFGIDELADPRLRQACRVRRWWLPRRSARRTDATVAAARTPTRIPATAAGVMAPMGVHMTTVGDGTPVSAAPVLQIRGLSVDYSSEQGAVHAVTDVNLTLHRGEVLGLAGESGSGKSTLAYAIARLLPASAVTTGDVRYLPPAKNTSHGSASNGSASNGSASNGGTAASESATALDVLDLSAQELRTFRWNDLAIVFQSAMNALNPVMTVGAQIDDILRTHRSEMGRGARKQRARELLRLVGIAADRLGSYPHELSGGMRQRAGIALALALAPEIIIMDEPTTALDVVVQREILSELLRLRQELHFAVIFITHDLSLLLELADRIAIMYAGRIVEQPTQRELYQAPRHPYSYGLINSFPRLHGPRTTVAGIPGSPPDLRTLPSGCAFHPRCPLAFGPCRSVVPELRPAVEGSDHLVACHLYDPAYRPSPPDTPDIAEAYKQNAGRSRV